MPPRKREGSPSAPKANKAPKRPRKTKPKSKPDLDYYSGSDAAGPSQSKDTPRDAKFLKDIDRASKVNPPGVRVLKQNIF